MGVTPTARYSPTLSTGSVSATPARSAPSMSHPSRDPSTESDQDLPVAKGEDNSRWTGLKRSRRNMEENQVTDQDQLQASPPSRPSSATRSDISIKYESQSQNRPRPTDITVPTSGQGNDNAGGLEESQDEGGHDSSDDDAGPGDKIEDFDWDDLERRYHDAIKERDDDEHRMYQEFQKLMEYFQVWAQTTSNHENDRSFKRLKTRMFHIQNSEARLEERRQHYKSVVEAFQRALNLLNK
ncbi:hypothetical protein K402DRAFT_349509 [Aulographum hederae CBS 113979]|uniref:Uncharacterized protein n=1 Tax=Aulographum hederae CBS 113979 TaxID=1176131 RepID=A0A6G1H8M6_9PEZI|nr:hypothetical protein K402DRAFT_349509 [Aulographum hederae CBS 113979]